MSDYVSLKLAQDVPLQVEFEVNGPEDKETAYKGKLGYLRYYLAPKVSEGDEGPQEEEGGYEGE